MEDEVRIPAELYKMISDDVLELTERDALFRRVEEGLASMSVEEMLTSSSGEVRFLGTIARRMLAEQEALLRRRFSTMLMAAFAFAGLVTLVCTIFMLKSAS